MAKYSKAMDRWVKPLQINQEEIEDWINRGLMPKKEAYSFASYLERICASYPETFKINGGNNAS